MTSKEIGIGLIDDSTVGKVHSYSWMNLLQFYSTSSNPRLITRDASNWRDILDDSDINIVDVCSSPDLHPEICLYVAEKGKAILCEAPLSRTADEAYEIYQAIKKSSRSNMIGFNKRFFSSVLYARKLIRSDRLGKITHVVGNYYRTAEKSVLNDLGSQLLDLMRFLVGDIISVAGASQTFDQKTTSEQSGITGCLRFAGGAVGTISLSGTTVPTPDYLVLEVYGTRGSFKFYSERPAELELYLHEDKDFALNGFRTIYCTSKVHPLMQHFWPDQGTSFGFEQSFISEIAYFLSAVEKSQMIGPLGASFYDGYVNALICDQLTQSTIDGAWHAVKPKPA
jgi:predicted dehydrogenase